LQRPVIGGQFLDRRGAQRGDPGEAVGGVGVSLRCLSASIRAVVIIPRSPTRTSWCRSKLPRTTSTAWVNAVGSAVLPANTRTATGRPFGSVSSP